MKSSTLHRSNLTKERMDLLREIKAQRHASGNNEPGIYVRPAREKELDVLWQTFNVRQKNEKSLNAYIVAGFIGGALAMFLLTALISFATHALSSDNLSFQSKNVAKTHTADKLAGNSSKNSINFLPSDNAKVIAEEPAVNTNSEQYTIQSGDTLDKIAIRFYGKYDADKINRIAEVNNITNPHKISIGQVIAIPMD